MTPFTSVNWRVRFPADFRLKAHCGEPVFQLGSVVDNGTATETATGLLANASPAAMAIVKDTPTEYAMPSTTVIGFLGTQLDRGIGPKRWEKWRPTVSLFRHGDLLIDRVLLLYDRRFQALLNAVTKDIRTLSPETEIVPTEMPLADPWDFEEVYGALHDFARRTSFPEDDELLIHITTGSHVAQICLFLLTESRFLPGKLLQSGPAGARRPEGRWDVIDLDLARYDAIAQRFHSEQQAATSFLKAGIATRNEGFNKLIDRIEQVSVSSSAPLLLTGPTGAGKSQLARRIYALKHDRHQVRGPLVEVNCATIRGDGAMSALFGHVRGAFTGADRARDGLLRTADGGLLFLDEVGELGLDEQAMLLRAIEDKVFLPVGSDREVGSDFQLIAGSNRDLRDRVREGMFREDLLARIDLWHFFLPGLADRREDIGPNVAFELERFATENDRRVQFNAQAKRRFLAFATGPDAAWSANFRDLNAAITRMGTLAPGGRISSDLVDEEVERLKSGWTPRSASKDLVDVILGSARAGELDRFDRVQLHEVLATCLRSRSMSEAGRSLFARSRERKTSVNDADRVRKYLAKYGLSWAQLTSGRRAQPSRAPVVPLKTSL